MYPFFMIWWNISRLINRRYKFTLRMHLQTVHFRLTDTSPEDTRVRSPRSAASSILWRIKSSSAFSSCPWPSLNLFHVSICYFWFWYKSSYFWGSVAQRSGLNFIVCHLNKNKTYYWRYKQNDNDKFYNKPIK